MYDKYGRVKDFIFATSAIFLGLILADLWGWTVWWPLFTGG